MIADMTHAYLHRLFAGLSAASVLIASTGAAAAVCASGPYRAGCAGPNGAVVVHKVPVVRCHYAYVNGVRVCHRY